MGKISFTKTNKIAKNKSEDFSNLFSAWTAPTTDGFIPFQLNNFNINIEEMILPSFFINKSSSSIPKNTKVKFILDAQSVGGTIFVPPLPATDRAYSIKKLIIANIFVKELKRRVCFGLPNLEELILPDQLESVENGILFGECYKLKKIFIGSKLNITIGAQFFSAGVIGTKVYIPIEDLVIHPSNPYIYFDKSRKLLLSKSDNKKLLAYVNVQTGSPSTYTIDNQFQEIGDYAFYGNPKLNSIIVPSTVNKLGIFCFASTICTTISLPNSITDIPGGFIALNDNISTLTIPASVTTIHRLAFRLCQNLTSVYLLGNAPTIVGGSTFVQTYPLTFYVCSSATGYGSTFGGMPVVTVTC